MSKVQRRRERDLKKVKEGKMDEAAYKRGEFHGTAFLVPVPYYYYYYPAGYIGAPGACAVVSRFHLCFRAFVD
jgi:hypothetical protein